VSLIVHRAPRADLLADGLADLLRTPLPDPFAQELVLVPARGVERWLSQRLSHRLGHAPGREDGVCAGVEFRSPASLVSQVLDTVEHDPWAPDHLVWPLLRVIDAVAGESWARVLCEHLGYGVEGEEGVLRRGRRYAVSRRLAGLFSAYAVQRPQLLADWEAGGSGDGGGEALELDLAWQPRLWRRLVEEVAAPSPVVRHAETVRGLRAGTLELDLPVRLSLFGHTRLSHTEAELLHAVGEQRDVHLWLPHPSQALWDLLRSTEPPVWRRDDHSHVGVAHPLLAAMARDVRETEGILLAVGAGDGPALPDPVWPSTVLGHLQSQVAANREPSPSGLVDDSVQVHACHGPARQVEVLREVILGLLADDPDLEPRDVLVMCPDIESYAPLITGAFGLGEAVAGSHPGHQLRVMLADRSPTQTNPLLGVLAKLFDLADGRAESSRVLDLLSTGPVRRRFGFGDDHLETITRWITRAGVRWAWDATGRERFGLAAFQQNTWRFGLDRVLSGVALSDDSHLWLGPTLPFDDVSTTDIALAGRLAEAVDRLEALTARLSGTRPAHEWLEVLADGVAQLAEPPRGEEWQVAQLRRELAALGGLSAGGAPIELSLPDIRAMLHSQLAGRPTRANFRTGTLTVCTMTPMRSVPHRVVCLLGVDDGVFPRGGSIDGDDVLARVPMVGERDTRSEDRQLFLDAVMAARDHLVITYTGFSESTGQRRPPAVPLREFLDVLARTTTGDVEHDHRSQAFHADYLTGGRPFSFDPDAASAARAAAGRRTPPVPLHALELDPPPAADIELTDLVDAVTSPVRTFLRRRLQIDLPREQDEVADSMPVALDGLETWQVGDRILQEFLAGRSLDDALQMEWRRGTMPPGRYGWKQTQRLAATATPLAEMFETSTQGAPSRAREISIDLGAGRRLVGTVTGLYDNRLVRVGYSRLRAKQRLEAWVSLVALCAAGPGPWVSRAIGRTAQGDEPARATYSAPEDPMTVIRELVALHDLAMTRAVPLVADTGRMCALTSTSSRPAWMVERDLQDAWRRENGAMELQVAWGRRPSWSDVTAAPPSDGVAPHLFAELARRLWTPILAAEVE
jgi:exodeoxyribonuclease V gamma subunit